MGSIPAGILPRPHQGNQERAQNHQRQAGGNDRHPARHALQAARGHQRFPQALQYRCHQRGAGLLAGLPHHGRSAQHQQLHPLGGRVDFYRQLSPAGRLRTFAGRRRRQYGGGSRHPAADRRCAPERIPAGRCRGAGSIPSVCGAAPYSPGRAE